MKVFAAAHGALGEPIDPDSLSVANSEANAYLMAHRIAIETNRRTRVVLISEVVELTPDTKVTIRRAR